MPLLQGFKVKILLLGEDESPQAVRVELSSEADLFFHYAHDIDETGFAVSKPFAATHTSPERSLLVRGSKGRRSRRDS
jgi:hypothetical protein